jgi:pyruvate kinase
MEMKIGGYIKTRCAVRVTSGKHSQLKLVTPDDIRDLQAITQCAMVDFISVPFISSKADM